jgi:hypothetical protein
MGLEQFLQIGKTRKTHALGEPHQRRRLNPGLQCHAGRRAQRNVVGVLPHEDGDLPELFRHPRRSG